jgi:hypothetical protein
VRDVQVELGGLEQFAEKVKEFFKAAIEKAYPVADSDAILSPEETGCCHLSF